jgi:hypothetical protein
MAQLGPAEMVIDWTPRPKPRGWKKAYGMIHIDDKDDIYVHPQVGGMGEQEAFLCCSYDNEPLLLVGKIVLVRLNWIRKEFADRPRTLEVCDVVERRAREFQLRTN